MDTALEIIAAMRRQEGCSYQTGDFLAFGNPHLLDVDAGCRTKMAEWCFQIVDFCKFQHESVEIAMNFLDRYLFVDTSPLNSRVLFQLASMTCLYMAVKIHEPEAMDPSSISALSRGTYSVDEIEDMEIKILNSLQWRVNPPTSFSFARQLLTAISDDVLTAEEREAISHLTAVQLELAVSDYDLITVKPSTKAFCAVANAVDVLCLPQNVISCVRRVMAQAIGVDEDEENIRRLCAYLFAAVAQREPSIICACQRGKKVQASPFQSLQRNNGVEVSPRSATLLIVNNLV